MTAADLLAQLEYYCRVENRGGEEVIVRVTTKTEQSYFETIVLDKKGSGLQLYCGLRETA